nr:hypothetical protein [Bacteroidota bacterium]
MENEKEKIKRDLRWWIEDLDDLDMLYELTDMKTDYEDRMEKEGEENVEQEQENDEE